MSDGLDPPDDYAEEIFVFQETGLERIVTGDVRSAIDWYLRSGGGSIDELVVELGTMITLCIALDHLGTWPGVRDVASLNQSVKTIAELLAAGASIACKQASEEDGRNPGPDIAKMYSEEVEGLPAEWDMEKYGYLKHVSNVTEEISSKNQGQETQRQDNQPDQSQSQ